MAQVSHMACATLQGKTKWIFAQMFDASYKSEMANLQPVLWGAETSSA
jgi:hypothetical protein